MKQSNKVVTARVRRVVGGELANLISKYAKWIEEGEARIRDRETSDQVWALKINMEFSKQKKAKFDAFKSNRVFSK